MQIHHFGEWIKVKYWDSSIKYLESLPEDLSKISSVNHLFNGLLHNESGPAIISYNEDGSVYEENII